MNEHHSGADQGGSGDRRLDSVLRAYLAEQGWGELSALAAIEQIWSEVAGGEVAVHVRPKAVRAEALIVSVDHPSWAAQLSFLAPELLRRLSEKLGERAPKRLETTVRRA